MKSKGPCSPVLFYSFFLPRGLRNKMIRLQRVLFSLLRTLLWTLQLSILSVCESWVFCSRTLLDLVLVVVVVGGGGSEVNFLVLIYFIIWIPRSQELFTELKKLYLVQNNSTSKLGTSCIVLGFHCFCMESWKEKSTSSLLFLTSFPCFDPKPPIFSMNRPESEKKSSFWLFGPYMAEFWPKQLF